MVGIEFNQPGGLAAKATFGLASAPPRNTWAAWYGELLNKHRIITAYTLNNPNVIRLEPPLNVGREELDILLEALDSILASHKGFMGMAASGAKTMFKSLLKKQ